MLLGLSSLKLKCISTANDALLLITPNSSSDPEYVTVRPESISGGLISIEIFCDGVDFLFPTLSITSSDRDFVPELETLKFIVPDALQLPGVLFMSIVFIIDVPSYTFIVAIPEHALLLL